MNLTDKDKEKVIQCIKDNKPIPSLYKQKLFRNDDVEYVESTKDYKLVYKGKERKEDVIANTPAAPLQKMRSFNSDNAFKDDWSNMLIYGDNLLALKALYKDQQGPNKYKTKNNIKLIYIDPPFSTKQDFLKDREKAYRDKIIGAKFIEFLRKRLILLREILADDGSIYVHLDYKKGHYIKTILDEVFGEHNFINEIVWHYFGFKRKTSKNFPRKHDVIYSYGKSENRIWNNIYRPHSDEYISRFKKDEDGRLYRDDVNPTGGGTRIIYLDEIEGDLVDSVWSDIPPVNPMANERMDYPTQKPEELLQRIISASSNEGDIVLDGFIGSGTTLATAEKLNRKWIGIDCGKLSIYTSQKRILNLESTIGSKNEDDRREFERVSDWKDHSKSYSRGLFMVYEKARMGELLINDSFLSSFATFLDEHLKGNDEQKFSLACPEDKFKVKDLSVKDNERDTVAKAGDKVITIGRIKFLVSFIQPKETHSDSEELKSKEFKLLNAGIYDNELILKMEWEQYKPFVAKLFNVRLNDHKIHSFEADGHIGVHSAYIWDYPNQKDLIINEGYVHDLHKALGGKAGNKFYVIAPVSSLAFMQDEIKIDDTTYAFLKVPLSILMELINKGEPGALKQPTGKDDINEVIDSVGFDFISQPKVSANYKRATPENKNLFNADDNDYIIEMLEFKSDTLAYDPEEFENFETLSMVMVDTNYNEEYFNLSKVFWADDIVAEEKDEAIIRIKEDEFQGEKMMVIYMDKYGNELKIKVNKTDFS